MPLPGVSALCDYGIQTHLLFLKQILGKLGFFLNRETLQKEKLQLCL